MRTLLLIDAHALIHRSFHALPPLTSPDGRPTGALYGLARALTKTLAEDAPDYVAAAFDRPEPTFRKQAYGEYKAHRPPAPDELVSQLIAARELFETFGIPTFEKAGYEADDIIGTLTKKFAGDGIRVEILTGDLDTLQLVEDDHIIVRTMKRGVSDTVIYNEAAVRERYGLSPNQLTDYKGLVGDPSDNIPGVRGVGPKTATELLKKFGTLEKLFSEAPESDKLAAKALPHKKDALFSRKLATLDCGVPLGALHLNNLSFSGANKERLAPYFGSLGFDSLLRHMGIQKKAVSTSSPQVIQIPKPETFPSLFATKEDLVTEKPGAPSDTHRTIILDARDALGRKDVLRSGVLKVAPDWKPIIRQLLLENVEVSDPLFDLSIAGWLLDPDGKDFSLAYLAAKYLKHDGSVSEREHADRLARVLSDELRREQLMNIFETIEMPLVRVIARMENAGVKIDRASLSSLAETMDTAIAETTESIYRAAHGTFNINSPQQVAEVLLERLHIRPQKVRKTSTGRKRMDRAVLESLADAHPIVPLILQYREDFKVRTSFVEPLLDLSRTDGRIHTTFIQTGTGTGRLASEKPNLQNIPQESRWATDLRNTFVADEGFSFLSFDYSQLELRLLAHETGDAGLLRAFREGKDIHALTASRVFHVPEIEVTKDMRRIGKTLNFGIVYGMGARAFAATSGLPRADAERFIKDYFDAFPTIRLWQERVRDGARRQGYASNANGRRRWFPARGGQVSGEFDRAAINMPLQSLGADILKTAMVRCDSLLENSQPFRSAAWLTLSIHDELLFEVRDDIVLEVIPLLRNALETAYALSVPLNVDVLHGKRWGELRRI